MIEFSTELENSEISSVTLLKSDPPQVLLNNLRLLELLKGSLCGGFCFQYSYKWYIGQLELL